jgi:hypothetical protein
MARREGMRISAVQHRDPYINTYAYKHEQTVSQKGCPATHIDYGKHQTRHLHDPSFMAAPATINARCTTAALEDLVAVVMGCEWVGGMLSLELGQFSRNMGRVV